MSSTCGSSGVLRGAGGPEGAGDGFAQRGFADAGWTREAEDGAFHVGLELAYREVLEDSLLDLFEVVVVFVEYFLGRFDLELNGYYRNYEYPNAFAFHNPVAGQKTLQTFDAELLATWRLSQHFKLVAEIDALEWLRDDAVEHLAPDEELLRRIREA